MIRRRGWVVGLAAVALLGALLTAAASDARPAPGPAGLAVGVQFHGLWTDYTDPDRVAVLDALAGAGVSRVRIDASWAMLQPDGPEGVDELAAQRLDDLVFLATARGLRPLLTLWLTPPWANSGRGERALPDDPRDYARLAGWAAARWAGRVDWEIWNEPNSPEFLAGADPAGYAELLRATYPAIKSADPATVVVGGGVQYNDDGWLSRMYAAGAGGSFDVLATHPYQSPADLPPEAADDGSIFRLTHVAAVRELMLRNGDAGKPIWFTELGWSTVTGGPEGWQRGVSPARQAELLGRTVRLVRATLPYVEVLVVYRDRDAADPLDQVDGFGLLTHDVRPKPALDALRAAIGDG